MTIRAPLITRIEPRAPLLQEFASPGRLNDLLKGKDKQFGGAGQWKSYDYPNPRGAQYPTSLLTWTDPAKIWLIGKDKQFRGSGQWQTYDYPNPRGPQFPVDLYTFVNPLELQLIGKDKQFAGQGQWKTYDWPNPAGPRTPDYGEWVNAILPISGTVVFRKFVQQRWIFIARPFIQHDFYQNLLATTLRVSQAPFSQGNWPNPIGSVFPQDLRGYIQDLNLELIGQDRFFGAPGQGPANLDWPVPKGPVGSIDLRTWIVNLSQGTLAPALAQAPFTFTDWKNPWAAGFPIDLRSFLDANRLNNPPPAPAVIVVPPVGGGASGAKRYRQPPWWGDEKKRKLQKKVEAVQRLIQKKKEQIDLAPDLLRMERLIEQLQELQKRLMKLLEQIEELNEEARAREILEVYMIYRSLH